MAGGLLVAEVDLEEEGVAEVAGGGLEEDGNDIVEHSGQVGEGGGLGGRGEEEVGVVLDGNHGVQGRGLGLGDRLVGADGEQAREDGLELDVMGLLDAAPEVGGALNLQRGELDGARLVQDGGQAQVGGGKGLGLGGGLVRQELGGKTVLVLDGGLVWDGVLVVGGEGGLKLCERVVWKGEQKVLDGEGVEVWE